ncbi:permease-like cell division protein FtsX [Propionibacterium sp.]|uniref:permease-like cell division protein FtsX n=1 Tax=Propionibacterium sp. TaxID=1977903 RepID=UPI0039E9FCE1
MRYTFRETGSGLKRNMSMTISVIVTMWISLALFGASIMTMQQVNAMKGQWYDRIEVSVFLCTVGSASSDPGGNCQSDQGVTNDERAAIQSTLESDPTVQTVFYESKQQAFDEFQQTFADNPIQNSLTVEQMQESFRVKLKNPQNYQQVVDAVQDMPGVQAVQDLHTVLDPFFRVLNALQWGTLVTAALLLLAAALQIGNSIRISAYSRRREIGIMRLVGASNGYILLPFVLEALFAGVIGIVLAGASMVALRGFVVSGLQSQLAIQSLGWITWTDTWWAVAAVAVLGILLSIIPTLLATRRYLRV